MPRKYTPEEKARAKARRREYQRAWRAANADKVLAWNRAYMAKYNKEHPADPDKRREYSRRYYLRKLAGKPRRRAPTPGDKRSTRPQD